VSSDTASDVADNISFVFKVSVATSFVIKVILKALLARSLTAVALRILGIGIFVVAVLSKFKDSI
jgi:hypothetical protein